MCGIAGFLASPSTELQASNEDLGRAMADAIRHRGPDGDGIWTRPGVALAHRRLAVVDLTAEGAQPMASASGRYVITYNGEVYNFPELRSELAKRGQTFRGTSDTEVLLAAIEAWGLEGALDRCVGMFAFALWDHAKQRLHLVRDRLGEKPLYYGWSQGCFLFASELKALRAHPAFRPVLDRDAVATFLRFGYIPAPHSIYEGIHKLPPGCTLTVHLQDEGKLPEPEPYWSARSIAEQGAAHPFGGSPIAAVEALEQALRAAVRRCSISDVPLGVFLSGGIDSSTIAALLQAESPQPIRTFTMGFLEEGFDEAAHAREVAAHLATRHTELTVTADQALAVVPRLPRIYDEPFADSSQIPTLLVAQLAREHVTVALSGDGGDEIFGGYNRHALEHGFLGKAGRLPAPLRRGASRALRVPSPQQWDRLARALPTLQRYGKPGALGNQVHRAAGLLELPNAEARYESLLTLWEAPEALVPGAREKPVLVRDRARWARLPDFPRQMMYLDMASYLPEDILTKVDRASMAVSLETRAPFLNHDVVQFAWTLPPELKLRDGRGKWVLRQVLHRHVPPALVERPKMGFGVPLSDWLRGPLRRWAEELLEERRLREQGLLDPAPVRKRWENHLQGRNGHHALWAVLMLQAWIDAYPCEAR